MLVRSDTIDEISGIITGYSGLSYIINKSEIDRILETKPVSLIRFFNDYPNVRSHSSYRDLLFKHYQYVKINLAKINGTSKLYIVLMNYFGQLFNYTEFSEEILEKINTHLEPDNYKIIKLETTGEYDIYSLDESLVNYDCLFREKEIGNHILINRQCEKCIERIKSGDYEGAITNSTSMIEQLLQEIINHNGFNTRIRYNSKLKLFMDDVLLAIDMTEDFTGLKRNIYNKLKDAFSKLSDGLYAMRSTMSDAHRIAPGFEPNKREALLAVNTAKTVANFIVDIYFEKYGN